MERIANEEIESILDQLMSNQSTDAVQELRDWWESLGYDSDLLMHRVPRKLVEALAEGALKLGLPSNTRTVGALLVTAVIAGLEVGMRIAQRRQELLYLSAPVAPREG